MTAAVYQVCDKACEYTRQVIEQGKFSLEEETSKAILVSYINKLALKTNCRLDLFTEDLSEPVHISHEDEIPCRTKDFYKNLLSTKTEFIKNDPISIINITQAKTNHCKGTANFTPEIADQILTDFINWYMDFEDIK